MTVTVQHLVRVAAISTAEQSVVLLVIHVGCLLQTLEFLSLELVQAKFDVLRSTL